MTSENVAEQDAAEPAATVSAKAVDDQLIDELVSRAQARGLAVDRRRRRGRPGLRVYVQSMPNSRSASSWSG